MAAYGSANECSTYLSDRGYTDWAAASASPDTVREAARVRGSDFIDSYRARFPGTRVNGRSQEREWPRKDAYDREGELIDPTDVPIEVEQASYIAALLIIQGVDLQPDLARGGAVTLKRAKAGPLDTTTEWAEGASAYTTFQRIDSLLQGILTGGGVEVTLLRV